MIRKKDVSKCVNVCVCRNGQLRHLREVSL